MENNKFRDKKLKMLMLTDGNFDQASARIRAIQYIPLLEDEGYSVTFIPRIPPKTSDSFLRYTYFPLMKRLLWLKMYFGLLFRKWDVIYIQRLFIFEIVLKQLTGKSRLIFDFDDAIYLNSYKNAVAEKAGIMVQYADDVVVSTPWLNDFCLANGKNASVIPTPVETEKIQPFRKYTHKKPVIGWIGSAWTTGYLKMIEPVLQKLSKENEFDFLTVGAKKDYMIQGVNHTNMPWESGIESEALPGIDIGIMPLPDEDYARAKGGYKLYLYMAAGIPCIASPVGVNSSIINHGSNGLLASTENEWTEALKTLLNDSGLRNRMGKEGRKQAEELYDRRICFSKLITVLKKDKTNE